MKKERIIEILIILLIFVIGFFCAHRAYYNIAVRPNIYKITLHDVDGLIKGSPVRFMGIIVGHVRHLYREEDRILCEILITKPNTKIPNGSLAKVEFWGLAGSKSIEIMPPKTEDPNIKGIVTEEALRINDFMDIAKNLNEVLTCIKGFLDTITPQGALSTAKAISEMEDLGGVDKSLDELIKIQEQNKAKLNKFNDFQKYIDDLINQIQKK